MVTAAPAVAGKAPPLRAHMAATTSSSRCWVPLAYSSLAILLDQHRPAERGASPDDGSHCQRDGVGGDGQQPFMSLFPLHSWVLAATVCELLLLEGTLHASEAVPRTTGAGSVVSVHPDSQINLLLLEPDGGTNDASDGSDSDEEETSFWYATTPAAPRKVLMARHRWHTMSRQDRASLALLPPWLTSAAAASNRREKPPIASIPSSPPPPLLPLERRKKRKIGENEGELDSHAVIVDGTNCNPATDTFDAEIAPATTEATPSAQDLVASILDRVFAFTREHLLDFCHDHQRFAESGGRAARKLSLPRRKVSDSSDTAEDDTGDTGDCDLNWFSPESGEPTTRSRLNDIAVHWNQVKHDRTAASFLPQFLEASISTEGVLRRHAHEVTRVLVETFETRHLRLFFGYRKSSTPASEEAAREGLINLLKDFLFDTSHAMFAWQDFEMAQRGNRQNDESIAAALFDDRTLRQIGGMETGSIMRLALALGRSRRSSLSWTSLFATDDGKTLVQHHLGSRADLLGIGELRRGRRMRQRQPSAPPAVPVDFSNVSAHVWPGQSTVSSSGTSATACAPRSRASSIASLDDDPALPLFDSSGRIQVRMARKSPRWGVKLSRIGDMCVVESCESLAPNLIAGATQSDHLERGDQVLLVANHCGESAHSPAYRSLPRGANWFASMVNMFASSSQVTLLVQRVAPASTAKSV